MRLQRAHMIALASTRPQLAEPIADAQESLTDGWSSVLAAAQKKGFVRSDLDSQSAAVAIQALTLGRIVDDVAASHLNNEQWSLLLFEFVNRSLLSPND